MKLMDKLERKKGKYAIRNLMLYIILGNIAVYLLCMFNTSLVFYLYLDPHAVLSGQVWRLITFLFIPPSVSYTQLFMVAISLYFYYFIGRMLENQLGAFRFNVYYFIVYIYLFTVYFTFPIFRYENFIN